MKDGTMELMRGGHFRLRMNDGAFLDSTGRPPQGVGGNPRGKVLPAAARWVFIESPQGDRLRINLVVDNPSGYANPNLGGSGATFFGPRSSSLESEILLINDDCMIIRTFYRARAGVDVALRVR